MKIQIKINNNKIFESNYENTLRNQNYEGKYKKKIENVE